MENIESSDRDGGNSPRALQAKKGKEYMKVQMERRHQQRIQEKIRKREEEETKKKKLKELKEKQLKLVQNNVRRARLKRQQQQQQQEETVQLTGEEQAADQYPSTQTDEVNVTLKNMAAVMQKELGDFGQQLDKENLLTQIRNVTLREKVSGEEEILHQQTSGEGVPQAQTTTEINITPSNEINTTLKNMAAAMQKELREFSQQPAKEELLRQIKNITVREKHQDVAQHTEDLNKTSERAEQSEIVPENERASHNALFGVKREVSKILKEKFPIESRKKRRKHLQSKSIGRHVSEEHKYDIIVNKGVTKTLKELMETEKKKERAATRIQAAYRGYQSRKLYDLKVNNSRPSELKLSPSPLKEAGQLQNDDTCRKSPAVDRTPLSKWLKPMSIEPWPYSVMTAIQNTIISRSKQRQPYWIQANHENMVGKTDEPRHTLPVIDASKEKPRKRLRLHRFFPASKMKRKDYESYITSDDESVRGKTGFSENSSIEPEHNSSSDESRSRYKKRLSFKSPGEVLPNRVEPSYWSNSDSEICLKTSSPGKLRMKQQNKENIKRSAKSLGPGRHAIMPQAAKHDDLELIAPKVGLRRKNAPSHPGGETDNYGSGTWDSHTVQRQSRLSGFVPISDIGHKYRKGFVTSEHAVKYSSPQKDVSQICVNNEEKHKESFRCVSPKVKHMKDNAHSDKPLVTNAGNLSDAIQSGRMLHPSALHLQFQAEMNLLDSVEESRQRLTEIEAILAQSVHQIRPEGEIKRKTDISGQDKHTQVDLFTDRVERTADKEIQVENVLAVDRSNSTHPHVLIQLMSSTRPVAVIPQPPEVQAVPVVSELIENVNVAELTQSPGAVVSRVPEPKLELAPRSGDAHQVMSQSNIIEPPVAVRQVLKEAEHTRKMITLDDQKAREATAKRRDDLMRNLSEKFEKWDIKHKEFMEKIEKEDHAQLQRLLANSTARLYNAQPSTNVFTPQLNRHTAALQFSTSRRGLRQVSAVVPERTPVVKQPRRTVGELLKEKLLHMNCKRGSEMPSGVLSSIGKEVQDLEKTVTDNLEDSVTDQSLHTISEQEITSSTGMKIDKPEFNLTQGSNLSDASSINDVDRSMKLNRIKESLNKIDKLIQEEKDTAQKHVDLLNEKFKLLKERTRADIKLLIVQMREYKERGEDHHISALKSKQQSLLQNLERVREENKCEYDELLKATVERKQVLRQQKALIRSYLKSFQQRARNFQEVHVGKSDDIQQKSFVPSTIATEDVSLLSIEEETRLEPVPKSGSVENSEEIPQNLDASVLHSSPKQELTSKSDIFEEVPESSSHKETGMELGHLETRVRGLRKQLHKKKYEAEKLWREQQKKKKERLKIKEQSLLKQIQAYDAYIYRTKKELDESKDYSTDTTLQSEQPSRVGQVHPHIERDKETGSRTSERALVSEPARNDDDDQQHILNESTQSSGSSVETAFSSSVKLCDSGQCSDNIKQVTDTRSPLCRSSPVLDDLVVPKRVSSVQESAPEVETGSLSLNQVEEETPALLSEEIPEEVSNIGQETCEAVEDFSNVEEISETIKDISVSASKIKGENISEAIEDTYKTSEEISEVVVVDISRTGNDISEVVEGTSSIEEISEAVKDISRTGEEIETEREISATGGESSEVEEEVSKTREEISEVVEELSVAEEIICQSEVEEDEPAGEISEAVEWISKSAEEISVSDEQMYETKHIFGDKEEVNKPANKISEEIGDIFKTEVAGPEVLQDISEEEIQNFSVIQAEITEPIDEIREAIKDISEKEPICTSKNNMSPEEELVPDSSHSIIFETSVKDFEGGDKIKQKNKENFSNKVERIADAIFQKLLNETFGDFKSKTKNGESSSVIITKDELHSEANEKYVEENKTQAEEKSNDSSLLNDTLFNNKDKNTVDNITNSIFEKLLSESFSILSVKKAKLQAEDSGRSRNVSESGGPSLSGKSAHTTESPDRSALNVRKRVYEILAETSGSLSSPREKSKPQDFMVTTYDVFSPEETPTDTPQTGSPVKELTGIDAGSHHKVNDLEGSDNEGFSQEWFDEDFGLSQSRREAEELRLQQLQIEQEIQELEQAQEQLPYFYIREIPNKPPPPYTPPGQSAKSPVPPSVPLSKQDHFLPSTSEEITSLSTEVIDYLHEMLITTGDIEDAEAPAKFYEETAANMSDIKKTSRRIFKKLIFDLARDLMREVCGCDRDKQCAPWDWPAFLNKRSKPPPRTKELVQEMVLKQVLVLFGFVPKAYKEKLVIRWSRKKRDYVDEILMRESHEEESAWTNYDEDEVIVKNEIAVGILDSLLDETVQVLSDIRRRKLC